MPQSGAPLRLQPLVRVDGSDQPNVGLDTDHVTGVLRRVPRAGPHPGTTGALCGGDPVRRVGFGIGSRVTIGGTVIQAGGFLSFSGTSLTVVLDYSTGTAGASWLGGAPVFNYDGELSLHVMQYRNVQMSGTLVSGSINVSGF